MPGTDRHARAAVEALAGEAAVGQDGAQAAPGGDGHDLARQDGHRGWPAPRPVGARVAEPATPAVDAAICARRAHEKMRAGRQGGHAGPAVWNPAMTSPAATARLPELPAVTDTPAVHGLRLVTSESMTQACPDRDPVLAHRGSRAPGPGHATPLMGTGGRPGAQDHVSPAWSWRPPTPPSPSRPVRVGSPAGRRHRRPAARRWRASPAARAVMPVKGWAPSARTVTGAGLVARRASPQHLALPSAMQGACVVRRRRRRRPPRRVGRSARGRRPPGTG